MSVSHRPQLRRRATRLWVYACAVCFLLVALFPVYWIVVSSLSPRTELLTSPPRYLPSSLTLDNFRTAIDGLPFGSYFRNSVVHAVVSTVAATTIAFTAAYGFARYDFRLKQTLFVLLMLSMTLPPIATVIPLFRLYGSVGLIDTVRGLIILTTSALLPFSIWIFTAAIRRVPKELEEAARIDGAGVGRIMFWIVLPVVRPVVATVMSINFIISWNELLYPLVFANTAQSKPLTLGLVELTRGSGVAVERPWDLLSALAVALIVPVIVVVIAAKRHIVEGLVQGAVD